MARVAGGNRSALGVLIERHQEYVRKLAFRFVGHWDVADDLAQETFLRVWRAAGSYTATAAFSTWLYRLVLNLTRDWQRGQSYRQHAELNDRIADPQPAVSATLQQSEIAEAVRRAIGSLPDNQRTALILHRYAGLSHREISAVMGKSEAAVESYLVRSYASLRAALGHLRFGDETPPDSVG